MIGDEPANWGDAVTATCTVFKGDFPIDIVWSLNGEPISHDYPDVTISTSSKRVSVLTIDAVTARHAGEYTCSASNAAGGTSYSASLAVNGIIEQAAINYFISEQNLTCGRSSTKSFFQSTYISQSF